MKPFLGWWAGAETLKILGVVWIHFLADFILQSDKMAQNKSKSNYWLLVHVAVYTVPFLLLGWRYAAINGAAHFAVDWVTSRINSRLWAQKRVHAFFVGVGADQAIHISTLILTLPTATFIWGVFY